MKAIADFITNTDAGCANITVNTSIYALDAVHAASYSFIDRYHVLVTPDEADLVTVVFEAKDKGRNIEEDLKEFANTILDHQVRLQLDRTNGKIRDLIVAHAFSPLDLQKEAESL
jgi:His-Xaa-Ser system protein HxsD